jgi:RNA polymerase sigma-70 factor (ECF subfamily)
LRIVRTPEIADELLQETFWQVWKKAGDFRGGTAAAWVYRIARNKSLDQLRRQKVRPQPVVTTTQEAEQHVWDTLAAPHSDTARLVQQSLERDRVQKVLSQIPPEQRVCLELSYFEGMSQREIATHTGLPLGTVKTRIRLGLKKIETLLRADGS